MGNRIDVREWRAWAGGGPRPRSFDHMATSLSLKPAPRADSMPPRRVITSALGAAVAIQQVSVLFKRGAADLVAVEDIDIRIRPGEFVALLGPSGCGKSTLLNAIGGIVRPTMGSVTIDGQRVHEPSAACGVVFQHHSLFPWMTARANIAFGPKMMGYPDPDEIARQFLALVGLEKFADAYPSQLSGGMQQRVGIARALATRPPVLLMDEPFGALDAQTRSIMQEELLKIWSEFRTTVVFVTHDVDEAIFLSDRVFVMRAAPGAIKEEIAIDLGRPRQADVMASTKFGAIRKRVKALIRHESIKVFDAG